MTNEEKIKNMSTEKLADFLRNNDIDCECCIYVYKGKDCRINCCCKGIMEWLEEEAKE